MNRKLIFILCLTLIALSGCGGEEEEAAEEITGNVVIERPEEVQQVAQPEPEPPAPEPEEEIKTVKLCYDSDNSHNQFVKGEVFGFYDNAQRFEFFDECKNDNYVIEYYCENEDPKQSVVLCTSGCVDSACR